MNKEVSHTLGAKSAIAGYSTPSRPVAASKLSSNSSSPGQTGESRAANEPKMTLDDLAYNKIFVGGLHYDTRDGKCCQSLARSAG